jgi:hypothetical protein
MDIQLAWGIGISILSIILTVVAWRKGWGPRAVLPIVIATVLDLGVSGVLGESTPTAIIVGVVIDVVALAALALMVRQPPRRAVQLFA